MTASLPHPTFDGYQWLKRDIIRGVYQPEEKLRMSLLTNRYGLGVGPLREALSQLVAEHLVTVVSQKGYRVAPMSQAELLDIFDARANMESMLYNWRLSAEAMIGKRTFWRVPICLPNSRRQKLAKHCSMNGINVIRRFIPRL